MCKGVIFYLSSFASHCESPWKLVIQYLHYVFNLRPIEREYRYTYFVQKFCKQTYSHIL